jgi:hypothetical protein
MHTHENIEHAKSLQLHDDDAAIIFTQGGPEGETEPKGTIVALVLREPLKPGKGAVTPRLQLAITTLCLHSPECEDIMALLI